MTEREYDSSRVEAALRALRGISTEALERGEVESLFALLEKLLHLGREDIFYAPFLHEEGAADYEDLMPEGKATLDFQETLELLRGWMERNVPAHRITDSGVRGG